MAKKFDYLDECHYVAAEITAVIAEMIDAVQVSGSHRVIRSRIASLIDLAKEPKQYGNVLGRNEFIATHMEPVSSLGLCAPSWHSLVDVLTFKVLQCVADGIEWSDRAAEVSFDNADWLPCVDWEKSTVAIDKEFKSQLGYDAREVIWRVNACLYIEHVQTRIFLLGKAEEFGDGKLDHDVAGHQGNGCHRRGRGRPKLDDKYCELADQWNENRDALKVEFPTMEMFVAANLTTGIKGGPPQVDTVRSRLAKLGYKV